MDVRNLIAGFTGLGDGPPSPGWQRRMIGNEVLRDPWHRMRLTTKSPCRRMFQQVETTGGLMNPWAGVKKHGKEAQSHLIHPAPRGVAAHTAGYFSSYTLNSSALL